MPKNKENAGRIVNLRNGSIAATEALGFVGITTIYNHRELSHRSIKTKPVMEALSRTAMFMLGTVPRYWARTHISHHAARDANLLNILETADCLEYLKNNSPLKDIAMPKIFKGLDPVAELTPEEIIKIGAPARQLVKERYTAPKGYSTQELGRLLDPDTPRYFYPDKKDLANLEAISSWDQDLNRLSSVLVDPHSPALHRKGILGVLFDNVPLFKANQAAVKEFEEAGEYNLGKDKWDELLFDKSKLGLTAFFSGNIALQFALDRDLTPKGMVRSSLAGFAVTMAAAQGLKIGGDITNSGGHAGKSILKGLFAGKPIVKSDGTFTYNAKLFNLPTLDEVGGQDDHHNRPGDIAYTLATGMRKVVNAPFGSGIDSLTKHQILFEPGDQYGHPKIVKARDVYTLRSTREFVRPDEPMEAVLMLEQARVRTLEQAL